MTALREAEQLTTEPVDIAWTRSPEVFFQQTIDGLKRYLDEYGEESTALGGVRVLGAHVTENERFEYADGRDASQFFQQGEDARIAFRDEDGRILTPDLCVRIDMSEDSSRFENRNATTHRYYIASDGHIFEFSMPRTEQSHPKALAHTSTGEWAVASAEPKIPLVNAQRIAPANETNFMRSLLTLSSQRSADIARERAQNDEHALPHVRPDRPYVKRGFIA